MSPTRLFPVETTYSVINRFLTNLDGRSTVTGFVTRYVDPRLNYPDPQYLTFDVAFSSDSGGENRLKLFVTDPAILKLCFDGLREGMEITATGKLSIYPQNGHVQLNCESLELHTIFRMERLPEKRAPIPLPGPCLSLALITSPNSEALGDFQRYAGPYLTDRATLYPTPLEAPDSDKIIASLIDRINSNNSADLIALVRGGGDSYSINKTFSSPTLCRAVRDSHIPVAIGLGHDSNHPRVEEYADAVESTPSALAILLNSQCSPSPVAEKQSSSFWRYLPLAAAIVVLVIFFLLFLP